MHLECQYLDPSIYFNRRNFESVKLLINIMQMNSTDSCTLELKVSNCQLSKDVYSCTPSTYVFRGDNFAVHIFLWVGGGKLPLTKT